MDLSDALGQGWPGQPNNSTSPAANLSWPGGQPAGNPSWPGGQPAGNPTNPSWPGGLPAGSGGGQPSQPNAPPAQSGGWPSPAPGTNPVPSTPQILKVPHSQILPQGVFDKLLITIAGTVKSNAQKITIDMNAGKDLAFHLNPRFNENGKKVIVRNCRINNKWGKEERDAPCFPFSQGQPFEMKILCTNSEFNVAVNNSHLLSFTHKIRDLSTIKSFNIHNDVTLSKVHVEKLP